jgi:hypothetical protein
MQVLDTLKQYQMVDNLDNCEFPQQLLVYLEYVISVWELNIDRLNMDSIIKWIFPTIVIEFRIFFGTT